MQLEWSEHSGQLVGAIADLLDHSELLDVTLSAEGRQLKAHRLVLAAASDYFRELLTLDMDQLPIIYLRDVAYAELQYLLQFIYSGKTDVPCSHLSSFLALASSLGIRGFSSAGNSQQQQVKPRTPAKRKLLLLPQMDKENQSGTALSPIKHTMSEPVDHLASPETLVKGEKKRRFQARSLDAGKGKPRMGTPPTTPTTSSRSPLSPLTAANRHVPIKTRVLQEEGVFKKPLPPSAPVHFSANSCPVVEADKSSSGVKNLSFDSTAPPLLLDPNELAAKGATLLHHLALWMLEEKRIKEEEEETVVPLLSSHASSNTFPQALRGRNASGARRGGSECDRPDSGFDSKDEGRGEGELAPAAVSEPEEGGLVSGGATSSQASSPEVGEILRQAAIRQPVFRKRRMNNH